MSILDDYLYKLQARFSTDLMSPHVCGDIFCFCNTDLICLGTIRHVKITISNTSCFVVLFPAAS